MAQHISFGWFIGSWVYFHAFFNKASMKFKLHHWVCSKAMSWQGILWSIMIQFAKGSQKMQELIKEVWPIWTSSWFLDHKCINLSFLNIWKWLLLIWVLIIIHNNLYSHGKSYCARKIVKIERIYTSYLRLSLYWREGNITLQNRVICQQNINECRWAMNFEFSYAWCMYEFMNVIMYMLTK